MVRLPVGLLTLACLLVPILGTARPAVAAVAAVPLTLGTPTVVGQDVTFYGKVRRPGVGVALQEWRSGRWVTVGWDRANAQGRYRLTREAPAVKRTYRAKWGSVVSRTRTVAGTDACGTRPRKYDGTLWRCTFVDEFSSTELDGLKWQPLQQAGRGDEVACNVDDPRTLEVSGGQLRLTVREAKDGLVCPMAADLTRATYASASVTTRARFAQQYGRFEARYRSTATAAPGLQEAFWLWPAYDIRFLTVTWPESGEIDVAETYSRYPDLAIPYLHYNKDDNGGPRPGLNTAYCAADRGDWHTFTLEWTEDRLTFLVDGRHCLTNTDGAATFRRKFFLNLTQLIGRGANAYDGTAPLPATMSIDYVKVWE